MSAVFLGDHKNGATIRIRVQPRSSRTGPMGVRGEALKWGVRSAPVDGKANEELIELIAEALARPKRSILIVRGDSSRDKVILVEGVTKQELDKLLSQG